MESDNEIEEKEETVEATESKCPHFEQISEEEKDYIIHFSGTVPPLKYPEIADMDFMMRVTMAFLNSAHKKVKLNRAIGNLFKRSLLNLDYKRRPLKFSCPHISNVVNKEREGYFLGIEFKNKNFEIHTLLMKKDQQPIADSIKFPIPKVITDRGMEEFTAYIAECISDVMGIKNIKNSDLSLGILIPFKMNQLSPTRVVIYDFGPNIEIPQLLETDLKIDLENALSAKKLNVKVAGFLNPTIAVMSSCAYEYENTAISIYHYDEINIGYYEDMANTVFSEKYTHPNSHLILITNIGFLGDDGSLSCQRTVIDSIIDESSEFPGKGTFTKMICAPYVAEQFRLSLAELLRHESWMSFNVIPERIQEPYSIDIEQLLQLDGIPLEEDERGISFLKECFDINIEIIEWSIIKQLARVVILRSAYLLGVVLSVIVNKMASKQISIAVDGVFFNGCKYFDSAITTYMSPLIQADIEYKFVKAKHGSGCGAAYYASAL